MRIIEIILIFGFGIFGIGVYLESVEGVMTGIIITIVGIILGIIISLKIK